MLNVMPSPSHLVGLFVKGDVTADDIRKAIDAVEARLQNNPQISLFVEMDDISGVSGEALGLDLRYAISKWRDIGRFHRVAVVTDQQMVRNLVRFERFMLPHIELKLFGSNERTEALAWASDLPPAREAVSARIRPIAVSEGSTVAFEIDESLTAADFEAIVKAVEAKQVGDAPVSLLLRIRQLKSYDFSSFTDDIGRRVDWSALKTLDRCALVGGPTWLRFALSLVTPLSKAELRAFPADEERLAWAWVGAEASAPTSVS